MIRTKKELLEVLSKSKRSALDKIFEHRVSEELLRRLIEDRKEDNLYFFEKFDEVDKKLQIIENNVRAGAKIERLEKQRDEWKGIAQKLKAEKQS